MKPLYFILFSIIILCTVVPNGDAYEYSWQIAENLEGQEYISVIAPVEVILLDAPIEVSDHSSALHLMHKYSVVLDSGWSSEQAYKLWRAFEVVPQEWNYGRPEIPHVETSVWRLSERFIENDIQIEYKDGYRLVTIGVAAFTYATPLLAEIEGVRGRIFSRRLHNAVVRFVTDNGADAHAMRRILRERYAVSIDVPDYKELTQNITGEDAGRFSKFKDEELIALVSMFEEYPSGMLKTPGLKYLVRRLDGTPHPLYPTAPAVAWTSAGYIEFMESAFKEQGLDYIHRLILHEKAHFLWDYLFDDQLKQDWIKIGGWYQNPDDTDGWSTTQQTEFVSAYAHSKNPNEDMAESISYYIVNPDKLRSRAPAKYKFIQNRIMHGTRYISQIREDLTFEVYNLYPDYVYPGRIIRVDIDVEGAPKEDKRVTVEIEIYRASELDTAQGTYLRIFSNKGTFFDIHLSAVSSNGQASAAGHIFRGHTVVSKYAASGYWSPESITFTDANGNERHESQTDYGWKLYIDNPLADCDPPKYVPQSAKLIMGQPGSENGRHYQRVIASWQIIEANEVTSVSAWMNDSSHDTYSRVGDGQATDAYGTYNSQTYEATVELIVPDYFQSGVYALNRLSMRDSARNTSQVYFTTIGWGEKSVDESPATINIRTTRPDSIPPVLDLNDITIDAEPTTPKEPNGETKVDITFKVKDNISGFVTAFISLRDPHGTDHLFVHSVNYHNIYFVGDPTVWTSYKKTIILPVGSIPGTWGLSNMTIFDKAQNKQDYDFTEIVRFEITDSPSAAKTDVNGDGEVNILDLVVVANAFGEENPKADVNGDGEVNILDLVAVANAFGNKK